MGLPDRHERHELRVGDEERHAVVDALRTHVGAGRLTLDEFEERTAAALAARTVGELVPLTADLPAVRPVRRSSGPPIRQRPVRVGLSPGWDLGYRIHVTLWWVLSGFLVLVWLASGAGYFWPVWPFLGIGLSVGIHAGVRRAAQG